VYRIVAKSNTTVTEEAVPQPIISCQSINNIALSNQIFPVTSDAIVYPAAH